MAEQTTRKKNMDDFDNNGALNRHYLATAPASQKDAILTAIANHYGTDVATIEDNIFDAEAEHLLEYMIEPLRTPTAREMIAMDLFRVA